VCFDYKGIRLGNTGGLSEVARTSAALCDHDKTCCQGVSGQNTEDDDFGLSNIFAGFDAV